MDQTLLELFINAYTITSQIMFPVLAFILVLLILDLNKYGKTSNRINKILNNLSQSIQDSGFKKNIKENSLLYLQRFINKKINKD